jgi:membrane dipeptidase
MFIVDAHEDLAWNMVTYGRDYTQSAAETRKQEQGTKIASRNGDTLLGWPDYQKGQVVVVFATLFAAPVRSMNNQPWKVAFYHNEAQAHRQYREQVDIYHRLVNDHPDKFRLISSQADLQALLKHWEANPTPFARLPEDEAAQEDPLASPDNPKGHLQDEEEAHGQEGNPVGLVLLMEGAEGVRSPAELEEWYAWGVRIIGPAWWGNRYTGGTTEPGPLTREGVALLETMAGLGFVLDLSHMDEKAVLQALDMYGGSLIASHSNAHALLQGVESNRHLSDRAIARIIERDGVIGAVAFNNFLKAGWRTGSPRQEVTLQNLAEQIDYICQIAGDARHAGIGSDFDGGFGVQSSPTGVDTIADLQKLAPILAEKGYSNEDIALILGQNWLNLLKRTLPSTV